MRKSAKSLNIINKTQKARYPSAEFLYHVTLEDYKRQISNYEKIYDRINIVLAFSGVLLVFLLSDFSANISSINALFIDFKLLPFLHILLYLYSIFLLLLSIIMLLVLSCSKKLSAFDSNSIKTQELYDECIEDASLWIISRYIKIISDIRIIIIKKQEYYSISTILIIVALIVYLFSKIIN